MARPKVDLHGLLLRFVAALEGSDPQETHVIKSEFEEALFRFASFHYRSFARQWRVVIDEPATFNVSTRDVSVSGLAWEAVHKTLAEVERKVRQNQEVNLAYVYIVLKGRCNDAFKKEHDPDEMQKLVPLEKLRQTVEDEAVEYPEDPSAHNPLDILTAQESLAERRESTFQAKQSFLEIFRGIWPDTMRRHHFRDDFLIESPSRLACFDQWGTESTANPSTSERILNGRVMAWYCQTFMTDRQSYDTTKTRLRKDMARFLSTEHNH